MEATPLLAEVPEACRSRKAAPAAVALLLSAAGCVAIAFSRPSASALSATLLYSKDAVYDNPSYGTLTGDDMVQKAWPGLTCDRTDDDKWGWGEPTATADNSGTNCVFGDSWFCEDHYTVSGDGVMKSVSQLLWHYCNSTCNATDENLVAEYGNNATLEGSSMLAACAFDGLKNMEEVCGVAGEHFSPFSSVAHKRRHLSLGNPWEHHRRRLSNNELPSVENVSGTVIYINETYEQEACNTHALCSTCLTNATTGALDPYCEAFMIYYDMTSKWVPWASLRSHTYNVQTFWLNVHFWCNQTVLEAIKEGTFKDKLLSGSIQNYEHIDVAVNNTEELRWWGTTSIH